MPSINTQEREQLSAAVEKISDYCAEGCSPNTAIIKTAKEMNLTPDRLPILVNAYNAGATADHWAQHDSVRSKTASFPIANLAKIRSELYPDQVKKAAARQRPMRADNAFSLSAGALFQKDPLDCYRGQVPMQKTASAPSADQLSNTNRDLRLQLRFTQEQTDAAMELANAELYDRMDKLAGILRRPEMPSFGDMCKTAAAVYGKKGGEVMQYIAETYPTVKVAKYSPGTELLPATHDFFKQFEEVLNSLDTCGKLKNTQVIVRSKCAAVEQEMDEAWKSEIHGSEMHRALLTPIQVKKAALEMRKEALREELDATRPFSRLETMLHPEWQGATEREYGILNTLNDPLHEARMRKIMNESLFIDIMNSDEFLKEQDPEEVLEAYNDLLEVAPHLRGKKILVRQALKEYLASGTLDLPTAGQLTKMDAEEAAKQDRRSQAQADQAARYADQRQRKEQSEKELAQREQFEKARWEAQKEQAAEDRALRRSEAKQRQSNWEAEQRTRKEEAEQRQTNWQSEQDLRKDEAAQRQVNWEKDFGARKDEANQRQNNWKEDFIARQGSWMFDFMARQHEANQRQRNWEADQQLRRDIADRDHAIKREVQDDRRKYNAYKEELRKWEWEQAAADRYAQVVADNLHSGKTNDGQLADAERARRLGHIWKQNPSGELGEGNWEASMRPEYKP